MYAQGEADVLERREDPPFMVWNVWDSGQALSYQYLNVARLRLPNTPEDEWAGRSRIRSPDSNTLLVR